MKILKIIFSLATKIIKAYKRHIQEIVLDLFNPL